MDEELRAVLFEHAEKVCAKLAKDGSFSIGDATDRVIGQLEKEKAGEWTRIRDHFAHRGVRGYLNKVIAQAKAADPEQRKLPGLESMPLLIPSEGAAILSEQLVYKGYHTVLNRLERKINSYQYKRRKPEHLEDDLRRLAEMKAFDPRFEKYSKDNPELTLKQAKDLEAAEPTRRKKGQRAPRKKKR